MKNQFVKIKPKYFNRDAVWVNVSHIVRIDEYIKGETTITLACPNIDYLESEDEEVNSNPTIFTIECAPEDFIKMLDEK